MIHNFFTKITNAINIADLGAFCLQLRDLFA